MVTEAKIKAMREKRDLSEVVEKLLAQYVKGEVNV